MVLRAKHRGKQEGLLGRNLISINLEIAPRTCTNVTGYFSVMLGGEVHFGCDILGTPWIKVNCESQHGSSYLKLAEEMEGRDIF